jgi:hypothetical protein
MSTLTRRLSRLEDLGRRPLSPVVRLFWHDEFQPCTAHPACVVEVGTGRHHQGVVRLSFGTPEQA